MHFVRRLSRQESTARLIRVQLKLLQCLGYFPMLSDVPTSSLTVSAAFRIRSRSRTIFRFAFRWSNDSLNLRLAPLHKNDADIEQWVGIAISAFLRAYSRR